MRKKGGGGFDLRIATRESLPLDPIRMADP